MITLWPLGLYFLLVVLLVGAMLGLSALLGERHKDRATGQPYESGILPTGSARTLISVQFYIVAVIFVIFDLEAVFFFSWAIAVRKLGWAGYAGVLVFTALLLTGLVYEWRQGALDWTMLRPGRGNRPRPPA